jgi:ketosteroid isomerase-like protein
MTYAVSRAAVNAFYDAYLSRDAQRIGALVDENVEWSVIGPSDVMQVCGVWRGRAAVIDRFARAVPPIVDMIQLSTECLLVDGAYSALSGRITCRHVPSGRTITHRVAHFIRYRNDKALSVRILNDSLDAAQQFVGHSIMPVEDAPPLAGESDLIAI